MDQSSFAKMTWDFIFLTAVRAASELDRLSGTGALSSFNILETSEVDRPLQPRQNGQARPAALRDPDRICGVGKLSSEYRRLLFFRRDPTIYRNMSRVIVTTRRPSAPNLRVATRDQP